MHNYSVNFLIAIFGATKLWFRWLIIICNSASQIIVYVRLFCFNLVSEECRFSSLFLSESFQLGHYVGFQVIWCRTKNFLGLGILFWRITEIFYYDNLSEVVIWTIAFQGSVRSRVLEKKTKNLFRIRIPCFFLDGQMNISILTTWVEKKLLIFSHWKSSDWWLM